jgi:hypothetical protein
MSKRNWRHILLLILVVFLGAILLLWSRPAPQTQPVHAQPPTESPQPPVAHSVE